MSIPKVIHYVWVGPHTLTPLAEKCIASWEKYLYGYQFKLWNENNIPMDHPFVREMYAQKRWAFVADYVRFWALEREGGIYLDTDTEVLKSFDPLCIHEAFYGKTKDGMIAAGVIGAEAHHPSIQSILSVYDSPNSHTSVRTSPQIVTQVLTNMDLDVGVVVYEHQYFNPCDDGERCGPKKLASAYARNHWAESWVSYARIRKLLRRIGVIGVYKWVRSKVS